MTRIASRLARGHVLALSLLFCTSSDIVHGQGIVLPSLGPINRSMGGAATAAPVDAIGANAWNPATITGFDTSRLDFGVELVHARTKIASSIPADIGGAGNPPLSGLDRSDFGLPVLPSIGLVYAPHDSCVSFGLGLVTIGGFGVNYPGSDQNPLLTAPPPNGFGVGPIYSRFSVLQGAATIAVQLTDHVSIGVAPTISIADLQVSPFVFASPNDANGDGFATYPPGTNGRIRYGVGVQGGIYVTGERGLHYGAAIKSPQWIDNFEYNSHDELGRPRQLALDIDFPMIVTIGAAYSGLPYWLFAIDARYIDYAATDGFDDVGFRPDGSIRGVGWKSVMSLNAGAQYQWSDRWTLRAGGYVSDNPVPDQFTFFNAASSSIAQSAVFAGASWRITPELEFTFQWGHFFLNHINGPFVTPAGPVPGSSIKISQVTDTFGIGVSVHF